MYYSRIITPCVTEFFYINSLIVLFNISAELFFANAAVLAHQIFVWTLTVQYCINEQKINESENQRTKSDVYVLIFTLSFLP